MDVYPDCWRRRENGAVDLVEVPRKDWPRSPANKLLERKFLCQWQPPYQMLRYLPDWFDLRLVCDLDKEGIRRFSPVAPSIIAFLPPSRGLACVTGGQGLSLVATIGGHAILNDRGEIGKNFPFSYDEARLFFRYIRHLREYYGDTAKLGRVLHVVAGGRISRDVTDVLPEDIGLDSKGNGVRWSLGRFKEEGLQSALNAGIVNPAPQQVLRYGLLSAAKINPLFVRQEQTKELARLALFDLGTTTEEVTEDDLLFVAKHVRNWLRDHLDDDPQDFDVCLKDPKANLINRIAKRRDCNLDRIQVRKVLLELGWKAIQMLGRCVDKQMQAFRNALPDPLTETEQALFDNIYCGHPAYGGLPSLMLQDRFDFLREAILHTWEDPHNERAIAILHRMMFHYSELVSNRRAAEEP